MSAADTFATIRSSDDPVWGGLGGMVLGDLGDLDGDGWPEIYDGAPLADDGSGRLDVFSTPFSGALLDDDADVSIREVEGGIDYAAVGSAVTRLDAPSWAFAGVSLTAFAGSVFVVDGYPTTSGPAELVADVQVSGRKGDGVGGVASGDLDGDGILDLIIGFPSTADDADRMVAVPGPVDFDGAVDDLATVWTSPWDNDQLGESVAALGDQDGDGLTDLVVGAFGSSNEFLGGGAAYVLLSDGLDGSQRDITEDSSLRVDAENELDSLGDTVADLGDLDGDGVPEIGITASRSLGVSLGTTLTPARVYLIRSPAPEGVTSAAGLDGALTGSAVGHEMAAYGNGWSTLLAAAGDADGDGFAEFLVGSPLVQGGYYERVGRVDLVDGWPF
jgi:hypothetical protein